MNDGTKKKRDVGSRGFQVAQRMATGYQICSGGVENKFPHVINKEKAKARNQEPL